MPPFGPRGIRHAWWRAIVMAAKSFQNASPRVAWPSCFANALKVLHSSVIVCATVASSKPIILIVVIVHAQDAGGGGCCAMRRALSVAAEWLAVVCLRLRLLRWCLPAGACLCLCLWLRCGRRLLAPVVIIVAPFLLERIRQLRIILLVHAWGRRCRCRRRRCQRCARPRDGRMC